MLKTKVNIYDFFKKKFLKSGKLTTVVKLINRFNIISEYKNICNEYLFYICLSKLMIPIDFKIKKLSTYTQSIPYLIHYHKSNYKALDLISKVSKKQSFNNKSISITFFLENINTVKNNSISLNLKNEYIKKALTNRTLITLINFKNKII